MHLVIRADGGPEIGYGHLVRTGAFAEQLLANGAEVTYATTTPPCVEDVCPDGVGTVTVSKRDDPESFLSVLDELSANAVVIDSYAVDTEYMRNVRESVPLLAVVTDDARVQLDCDVVVNGNIYAQDLTYEWRGDEPRWCLGPDYALLRGSVRDASDRPLRIPSTPSHAVVTMGGSDVRDTTPTVMRAFDGTGLAVDVVVGPGFSNRNEISSLADELDAQFEIHTAPDNIVELFARADVAVSGCGSTTYELLALGTPFVAITMADNQRPIGEALCHRDVATVLDMDPTVDDVRTALSTLVDETDLRRRRAKEGRQLVDGRGVERVYQELLTSLDSSIER